MGRGRTQAHEKGMLHRFASIGIGIAIGIGIDIGGHFAADADSDPDTDSDPEALRYQIYFRDRIKVSTVPELRLFRRPVLQPMPRACPFAP